MTEDGVGTGFGIWTVAVVVCCFFVGFTCYYVVVHALPPKSIVAKAKRLESEAYALAIAYTCTILILTALCGEAFTSYLTNGGDDDTAGQQNNECSNLSIWYPVVLTFVLSFVKANGLDDTLLAHAEEPEHSIEAVRAEAANATTLSKPITAPSAHSSTAEEDDAERMADSEMNITTACCYGVCDPVGDVLDQTVLKWDHERVTKISLLQMFNAFLGYMVGCAWFSYATLSFQNNFTFIAYGYLLGLFTFAVMISYIAVGYLTRMTVRMEMEKKQGSKFREKRSELMFTAAR